VSSCLKLALEAEDVVEPQGLKGDKNLLTFCTNHIFEQIILALKSANFKVSADNHPGQQHFQSSLHGRLFDKHDQKTTFSDPPRAFRSNGKLPYRKPGKNKIRKILLSPVSFFSGIKAIMGVKGIRYQNLEPFQKLGNKGRFKFFHRIFYLA